MKFLLVALNAKYIHSNPALYSLRAYVGEELQEHVEIAEYTINHAFTDVLADIYQRKPDVIGLSCYIWNIEQMLELVTELGKLMPQVPIWLGGPEVTYDAPGLLEKYPQLAGIMIGEGEATFRELLGYYVNRENCEEGRFAAIPGLCLPGGFTTPRELTDISTLPFLYEDMEPFQNRIIYYESSRGCPFRCSYCLSSIDKKVRLRDMSVVKKELQFFLDKKVKQVKFVDRTFNCNHEHAASVWKYLLDNDNGVTNFHFEIAADLLNEEELKLLGQMRPGLVQLEIGVQSTNPKTLEAIHRVMDVEKLATVVARINAGKNVHQHLDLIAGLPYEDYESFGRSFNRVYAMEPEQLQLGFLKVLKGSEMCERAAEYGIYYTDKAPYEVLFTKWLSFDDVLRLKKIEEMVELYYNSNQFVHTLQFLEQAFETPFALYEALADFYEKRGYFVNSPARSYRYQMLLEFACEYDGQYRCVYRELLTYDMYLRENLKSRPDFAKDLGAHKEVFRAFYKQEEEKREYLPAYEAYDSKQLSRMTHLEPFAYPVWERMDRNVTSVSCKKEYFVLYDYQERSPLTGEARTVVIDIEGLKAKRNAEYLAMLDKSIAEAEAGGFIAENQAEMEEYVEN
ncbi:MAG: B12-binding domain-containing radical SAM protein [Lachnospiraceae bacterium]|nr:B12-binding domain-containing radical SAM protein [Lachnospiraceae bacterium]